MSGTEVRGSTVIPTPLATMWRIVSSDDPSKVFWMPSAFCEKRESSGQTLSTWSRKQWPLPSSSMVCCLSASGSTADEPASAWPRGTATTKGSSYSGTVIRPASGNGSAMMAQSISPCLSSSTSRAVKFSCSISGICGTVSIICLTSAGSRYGPIV